jgi:hypothetical protein
MPGIRRRAFPLVTAAFAIPTAILVAAALGEGSAASANPSNRTQVMATPVTARMLLPGVGIERGLQVDTILAERAISARFPEIKNIGGVRPDTMKWHPEGLAIDVVIPDYRTPAGKALGDRVMKFAFQNADRFGLVHVIWQQTYYPIGGKPHLMPNLGSDDANHHTHVHIATKGGGYPNGSETYVGWLIFR